MSGAPASSGPDARHLGALCYAAQAAGVVLYVLALWIEVYADTRMAARVAPDPFCESHRRWRLRSTLLFLVWTVLGGLTLPFGIGWVAVIPAFVWYVYRVGRGALRFRAGRPMSFARRTPQREISALRCG